MTDDMTTHDGVFPDFAIVGVMKAGTTSIADRLREHPDVFIPAWKEPSFFSDLETTFAFPNRPPAQLDYAVQTEAEYRKLFAGAGDRLKGEATAQYFVDPVSAERLHRANPNARIIVSLRDPVSRAYSAYGYSAMKDFEPTGFEAVCEAEMAGQRTGHYVEFRYLYSSLYAEALQRWYDLFGRENVLVVFLERLSEPEEWARIHAFLGIEPQVEADTDKRSNETRIGRTALERKVWALMASDNPLKRAASAILPESAVSGIKRLVRGYLARFGQKPESLSPELRARLAPLFAEDTARLAALLPPDRQPPWAAKYPARTGSTLPDTALARLNAGTGQLEPTS